MPSKPGARSARSWPTRRAALPRSRGLSVRRTPTTPRRRSWALLRGAIQTSGVCRGAGVRKPSPFRTLARRVAARAPHFLPRDIGTLGATFRENAFSSSNGATPCLGYGGFLRVRELDGGDRWGEDGRLRCAV